MVTLNEDYKLLSLSQMAEVKPRQLFPIVGQDKQYLPKLQQFLMFADMATIDSTTTTI